MKRPHLRLFRGRNGSPVQSGVGGALDEAYDFKAADERMEADFQRLIDELSDIESRPQPKPKRSAS